MKIGLGHLRLAPDVFWRMTLREFFAACEGYAESKGGKRKNAGALSPEEADELLEMLQEESQNS